MKALLLGFFSTTLIASADWPQWLGPDRDGTWHEEGVAAKFPEGGPKVLWRTPVGLGYSGPAVVGDRVFLMDYAAESGEIINNPGKAIALDGFERIRCFDAKTGKQIWERKAKRPYELSYPAGPRSTVTVDGDQVFALGAMGHLTCLDAKSGKVVWEKDLLKEYKGKLPIWGFSAHPLVHDGMVVTMVGGDDSAVVALDRKTGAEKWTALTSEEPGYCPPTVINYGGTEQMIIFTPVEVASLDPKTGKTYWSQPLKPLYSMSIAAPQFSDGKLYASGIGQIGALYELDPDKPAAKALWKGKPKTALYSANATPVIVGDTMFGPDINTSNLTAVRLKDGERLWVTTKPVTGEDGSRVRHGTVFLTHHKPSGRFYLFNEVGELIIAELTPEGYKELDRGQVLEPTNEAFGRKVVWSAPAFALKSAFVRNDKELIRVDLSAAN